jgi:hypothetical protein
MAFLLIVDVLTPDACDHEFKKIGQRQEELLLVRIRAYPAHRCMAAMCRSANSNGRRASHEGSLDHRGCG